MSGWPCLIRLAFLLIKPPVRKTVVRETTGNEPERIISANTLPGPILGSWSASPTNTTRIRSGTACNRWYMSLISIMEHSSTIRRSPLIGFNSSRPNVPSVFASKRRWMVSAGVWVTSSSLFAARPVGAVSMTFFPLNALIIPDTVVVFPVPGPPVRIVILFVMAYSMALFCSLSYPSIMNPFTWQAYVSRISFRRLATYCSAWYRSAR